MEEYQNHFQTLFARPIGWHVHNKLNGRFEVDVEKQNPPNLVTAMNLLQAMDIEMQLNWTSINIGQPETIWAALKPVKTTPSLAANQE